MIYSLFDYGNVIFWTIVYLLIVYNSIKYKSERNNLYMPLLPCSFNFAWEFNALIVSGGFWGHILWFGLDAVIFAFNLRYLRVMERRLMYVAGTLGFAMFFWWLFRVPDIDGMLMSSFVMDIVMAFVFVFAYQKISSHGKLAIASAKLIGDCFAGLAYMNNSKSIMVIATIVFVVNLYYLVCCVNETT